MERFLQQHGGRIAGILSGFDRLLFGGSLQSIRHSTGLEIFLSSHGVLLKDFRRSVQLWTERIVEHAEAMAQKLGRPFRYLESPATSKEDLAQAILRESPVREGLVCVLSCVECCQSFDVRGDRATRRLVLRPAQRKCRHLYFYFLDREFGLMHVRLQTWLPFGMQVCLNGREYLARRLSRAGIGYEQQDNCFTRIDDFAKAQQFLDELVRRRWPRWLNRLARQVNPWLDGRSGLSLRPYYWTLRQSEYATDVLFGRKEDLRQLYPHLLDHAIRHFGSDNVLRFLGRRTRSTSDGEVKTDLRRRPEGVRIKHWVEENSIKMYDKYECILRIETTLNNPRRYRVRRRTTHRGRPQLGWLPLRKGVADIPRRVQISRAANERYIEALAVVGQPAPVPALLDPVSRSIRRDRRSYRGLRPISPEDAALFAVLLRGEFKLQGVRNADLRRHLDPAAENNPSRRRKASARTTRLLRLLRAHGLIQKVPTTRCYRVTHRGEQTMTVAQRLRQLDLTQLAA